MRRAFDQYDGKKKNKKQGRKGQKATKHEWYMKDNKSETVLIIDATPGECLKKAVEKIARKRDIKVKVVERRGRTVKDRLQKSNPFPLRKCGKNDCVLCIENMGVDCRKRGVVYEVFCKEEGCDKKYIGQTGRTLYERMKGHVNQNGRKKANGEEEGLGMGALQKHKSEDHGGHAYAYGVRVLDNAYGRPSRRMISEGVRIGSLREDNCFNRKQGWSFTGFYQLPEDEDID